VLAKIVGQEPIWLDDVSPPGWKNAIKWACPTMKNKRQPAWQRADHKFAVATVTLLILLFVAGLTNWFLSGSESIAAGGSIAKTTISH
jgi:hypothetical protein